MKFQEISDHLIDAHLFLGNHNDALAFAKEVGCESKLQFHDDKLFLITEQDEQGLTVNCVTLGIKTWIVKTPDGLIAMSMKDFGDKYIPVPG